MDALAPAHTSGPYRNGQHPPAGALAKLEQAARLLAEVETVADAKLVRDQAATIQHYLRQQRHSLDAQVTAAELKLRAERRIGELLARTVEAHRPAKLSAGSTVLPEGVSRDQSARWQRIATIPGGEFEQALAECRRAGEDAPLQLTTARFVELARTLAPPAAERDDGPPRPDAAPADADRRRRLSCRVLAKGCPELLAAAEDGALPPRAAAKLARLATEEQRAAVAELRERVRRLRRRLESLAGRIDALRAAHRKAVSDRAEARRRLRALRAADAPTGVGRRGGAGRQRQGPLPDVMGRALGVALLLWPAPFAPADLAGPATGLDGPGARQLCRGLRNRGLAAPELAPDPSKGPDATRCPTGRWMLTAAAARAWKRWARGLNARPAGPARPRGLA